MVYTIIIQIWKSQIVETNWKIDGDCEKHGQVIDSSHFWELPVWLGSGNLGHVDVMKCVEPFGSGCLSDSVSDQHLRYRPTANIR